ncbi:MAG: hypothetical protein DRR19_11705 [Candidatus Parabeggiatoa sp. nov. 1]|nr:MAG: hypothetical protein DRR19_11705 [Gammaproteobacteria bacterium]
MRLVTKLLALGLTVGLASCDGDDDGSSTESFATENGDTQQISLSGVVATGKAFQGTAFGVNKVGNLRSVNINADGTYSLALPIAPPYFLKAEGSGDNEGELLYSYLDETAQSATVHITSLTTAAIQLATGKTNLTELEDVFVNWQSLAIQTEKVEEARNRVEDKLAEVLTAQGLDVANVNIFNYPYLRANSGTGLDGAMDQIKSIAFDGVLMTMIGQTGLPLVPAFGLLDSSGFDMRGTMVCEERYDYSRVVNLPFTINNSGCQEAVGRTTQFCDSGGCFPSEGTEVVIDESSTQTCSVAQINPDDSSYQTWERMGQGPILTKADFVEERHRVYVDEDGSIVNEWTGLDSSYVEINEDEYRLKSYSFPIFQENEFSTRLIGEYGEIYTIHCIKQ